MKWNDKLPLEMVRSMKEETDEVELMKRLIVKGVENYNK
jgi:hypothetical protein